MKKYLFLTLITLCLSFSAKSQDFKADSVKISDIIYSIFDGMRESDTSKMTPYMHSEMKMQTLSVDEKGNKISQLSEAKAWLTAVANNTDNLYDEQIENLYIQTDGAVASAWMDYKFYLNNKLSHCGINSFQFIKINEKWKIIYIIDSRFKNNCR